MHDAIREAHELIGATLRDPRTQCQGKVVGMDLGREQPAIYVLWQEGGAAERIDMAADDFMALLEHLRARLPAKASSARQVKDSRESRRHQRQVSRSSAERSEERSTASSATRSITDDAMPRSAQG